MKARDSSRAGTERGRTARRALLLRHGGRALVATVLGQPEAARRHFAAAFAAGVSASALLEIARMAHLFGGFPRAIQGLQALAQARLAAGLPPPRDSLRSDRPPRPSTRAADRARGERLFRRIYGASSDRVLASLDAAAPGFANWILDDAYGRVLTRPGLTACERELLAVAALAALRCPLQLESHVRGARRLGASAREVAAMADAAPLRAGQTTGRRKSGARQTLRRRRQ